MGGAPAQVQVVAPMRAETGATFVNASAPVSGASSRAEPVRLRDQDFPSERDQIIRKICIPRAHGETCGQRIGYRLKRVKSPRDVEQLPV